METTVEYDTLDDGSRRATVQLDGHPVMIVAQGDNETDAAWQVRIDTVVSITSQVAKIKFPQGK